MKKPIHKLAIALWIVAALIAVLQIFAITNVAMRFESRFPEAAEINMLLAAMAGQAGGVLIEVAALIALGMIVELLDRVHWEMKNKS